MYQTEQGPQEKRCSQATTSSIPPKTGPLVNEKPGSQQTGISSSGLLVQVIVNAAGSQWRIFSSLVLKSECFIKTTCLCKQTERDGHEDMEPIKMALWTKVLVTEKEGSEQIWDLRGCKTDQICQWTEWKLMEE